MTTKKYIMYWSMGIDEDLNNELRLNVDGEIYYLSVDDKDVRSMQQNIDIRPLLKERKGE